MLEHRRSEWREGLRHGIPIACGYFFVSFTFGIYGVSLGFRWWECVLVSMTNLTSAGQVSGVGIIAEGGTLIELAVSQIVINLRYSLMGISLSQNTDEDFTGGKRAILAFGLTDEIYGVAANRTTPVSTRYYLGLMTLPYFGWAAGTLFGALFGSFVSETVTSIMTLAIYGMFIAIVVPKAKTDRKVLAVALLAAAISVLCYSAPVLSKIPKGFSVIVCAVIAAAAGAWLFPVTGGGDADE